MSRILFITIQIFEFLALITHDALKGVNSSIPRSKTVKYFLPHVALHARITFVGTLSKRLLKRAVTKSGTGTWDVGTRGRGDVGTRGRGDSGTWGRGTRGLGNVGTRGLGDVGTWGRGDSGTRGRVNSGTWGRGDVETRGLGEV